MHPTLTRWLLVVLGLIGIADSWYLTEAAYNETQLTCNISGLDGCNTVAQSAYSHLFGIPLGVYGVAFYALVFILAATTLVMPWVVARRSLYVLGIIGTIASVIFLAIQIFLIKALCVYCLGSAVVCFVIAFFAYWLHKRHYPTIPEPVVEPW